eukprot:5973870-Pleurochrysis_carterae.AAC.1
MNSAPASRAACRSVVVRSTSRLACSSLRRCEGGTSSNPMMFNRSRTGGGPPSGTFLAEKNLLTDNVEHGGDATTAAKCPTVHFSSSRV